MAQYFHGTFVGLCLLRYVLVVSSVTRDSVDNGATAENVATDIPFVTGLNILGGDNTETTTFTNAGGDTTTIEPTSGSSTACSSTAYDDPLSNSAEDDATTIESTADSSTTGSTTANDELLSSSAGDDGLSTIINSPNSFGSTIEGIFSTLLSNTHTLKVANTATTGTSTHSDNVTIPPSTNLHGSSYSWLWFVLAVTVFTSIMLTLFVVVSCYGRPCSNKTGESGDPELRAKKRAVLLKLNTERSLYHL